MTNIVFENVGNWSIREQPTAIAAVPSSKRQTKRSQSSAATDVIRAEFLAADGVSLEKVYDLTEIVRRGGVTPVLQFKVQGVGNERFVAAIRHASGALTFHSSDDFVVHPAASSAKKRRGKSKSEQQFTIAIGAQRTGVRRGAVGRAIKLFLLKVIDAIADKVIEEMVEAWESASFAKAGIQEGWVKVTRASLAAGKLQRAIPSHIAPGTRALLLLHGTFSDTAGSFRHLQNTDFFDRARDRYGDRIYGFEHFTLSKTPEENARDLLKAFGDVPAVFDVITYSRGGLVLRNIAERADVFGGLADRFKLGHAVLVASPNQGTPLATPDRWRNTVGWIATLLECLPDTPLTTAASFVAEAIVWIANKAGGSIPGLAAMNANGELVADIQVTQGGALPYSALAANHLPDANWLQRIADVGIDAFFGQANDLVVPTEGSWRVDVTGVVEGVVAMDRVACFGPGGNVANVNTGANHFNFFGRQESVDFIFAAFENRPNTFPKLNFSIALPNGLRGGARTAIAPSGAPPLLQPLSDTAPGGPSRPFDRENEAVPSETPTVFSDAFHLTILPPPEFVRDINADDGAVAERPRKFDTALIVASYAGGRVIAPLAIRTGSAGRRWQALIAHERKIKAFIDGEQGASIPSNIEMLEYGRLLFETLFPKNVKRLYDTARARLPGGRLSVIFTSAIPWVAQVPWEFCWDPATESFLVTEELEFIRNPLTIEPAEIIPPSPSGRLRILVVVAQPIDLDALSVEEESQRILTGFQDLIRSGLAEIEILNQATPQRLHQYVRLRSFDVVHFIGHGEYNEEEDEGYLVFENDRGMTERVSTRSIKEILGGRKIRLVFLNACETGRDSRGSRTTDFNRGVAQALVSSGIHSVVANQYLVLDIAAVGFAQHFYWGLARGETIGCAAREARIAVNYSIAGENIDWATPVVYARDPKAQLCVPQNRNLELGAELSPSAAQGESCRGYNAKATAGLPTTSETRLKVSVWDMEHSFLMLEDVLARLNAAQDTYVFSKQDLGAPLGSLQRVEDGGTQLYANAAEPRIQRARQELGTDYLIVVTPRRIMYDDGNDRHTGYFGWWGDKDEDKFAIVSSALDGLPRRGRQVERAITNLLVLALIGAGAQLSTHEGGSKTCPLYYNKDVDVDIIMGEQRLEASCKARIKRRMPNEVPALDKLLRVFDN